LRLLAVSALVTMSTVGVYLGAAQAAPKSDEPTVRFTSGGPTPLACGSHPDIRALSVMQGGRVTLANLIGVDATIDVGGMDPVPVADGTGVSVKLKKGEHLLRMVPRCALTGTIETVTITAGKEAPASSVAAASPESEAVRRSPERTVAVDHTALVPASPPPNEGDGADQNQDESGPEIYDLLAVPVERPKDLRGHRLLAVIATICMLGVTTAIIRAIVSQRASHAVSM
jgi:hypothetical protein